MITTKPLDTRAIVRPIAAGSSVVCGVCGEKVKFKAKVEKQQVICNVYVDGKWSHVEHFHYECYKSGGEPHGEVF